MNRSASEAIVLATAAVMILAVIQGPPVSGGVLVARAIGIVSTIVKGFLPSEC